MIRTFYGIFHLMDAAATTMIASVKRLNKRHTDYEWDNVLQSVIINFF